MTPRLRDEMQAGKNDADPHHESTTHRRQDASVISGRQRALPKDFGLREYSQRKNEDTDAAACQAVVAARFQNQELNPGEGERVGSSNAAQDAKDAINGNTDDGFYFEEGEEGEKRHRTKEEKSDGFVGDTEQPCVRTLEDTATVVAAEARQGRTTPLVQKEDPGKREGKQRQGQDRHPEHGF